MCNCTSEVWSGACHRAALRADPLGPSRTDGGWDSVIARSVSDEAIHLSARSFWIASLALAMTMLDGMPRHPPLPRITHQRDEAIDAVHEFAVGHGDEQREHQAEMQRQ